jgi:hypothetical protein
MFFEGYIGAPPTTTVFSLAIVCPKEMLNNKAAAIVITIDLIFFITDVVLFLKVYVIRYVGREGYGLKKQEILFV